jgi:hypothetical protein
MAENKGNDNKKKKPDPDKKTPKDYGFVKAFLDDHPAVKRIVRKAVKEGWTTERFQGSLKDTQWWKSHTDAQRKADVLSTERPEEYQRQIDVIAGDLTRQAQAMGLTYSPAQIQKYATMAFRNGYTANEITQYLGGHGGLDVDDATGSAGVSASGLREMAQAYGLKLSDATVARQVRAALSSGDPSGYLTGYQQTLATQAKSMYPTIADWLEQGHTVQERLEPFLEAAGQQLGIDPSAIDITDPKWTKVLNNGNGQVMSQDQWLTTLRTDQSYGWAKTSSAKNQASDFANQLLGLMRGGIGV